MATTPEIPVSAPEITQPQEEFIVPETLQQDTGIKVVQKNFKAQVQDDKGAPMIQTPPTQVITVSPPASQPTLVTWAKGDTSNSSTWLGAFWLRIIKKAVYFGWRILGGNG